MKKKTTRLFRCPDCAAEGGPDLPLSEFYFYTKRSTYCIRHHNLRNSARQVERLDPKSPAYDPEFHARRKAAKRAWAQRKLSHGGPEGHVRRRRRS